MERRLQARTTASSSPSGQAYVQSTVRAGQLTAGARPPGTLKITRVEYLSATLGEKVTYSPTDANRYNFAQAALKKPQQSRSTQHFAREQALHPKPAPHHRCVSPAQHALDTLADIHPKDDIIFTRTANRYRAEGWRRYLWGNKTVYTRRLMFLEKLLRDEPALKNLGNENITKVYQASQKDFAAVVESFAKDFVLACGASSASATKHSSKRMCRASDNLDGLFQTMCFNFPAHKLEIADMAKQALQRLSMLAQQQASQAGDRPRKLLEKQSKRLAALAHSYSLVVAQP